MKKIILDLLMILMTMSLVSAQAELPTLTDIGDISVWEEIKGIGVNGVIYGIINGDIVIYHLNDTWDVVLDHPSGNIGNAQSSLMYNPTDNELYYTGTVGAGNNAFKVTLSGTKTDLSNAYGIGGTAKWQCALNDDLQKIYCYGDNNGGATTDYGVHEYDITGDSWTQLNNFNYTRDFINQNHNCFIRPTDNDTFYCFGGYANIVTGYGEAYLKYTISTNTSESISFGGTDFAYGSLHYRSPYVYLYGGENRRNFGTPQNETIWINLDNDTVGTLPNVWNSINESWVSYYACSYLDEDKSYCAGGFAGDDFAEDLNLWELSWQDCVEDWIPSFSACSVNDDQVLTYADNNTCGTFDDLPLDNGTISSCNFCTQTSHSETTGCQQNQLDTTFWVDDTFLTCCDLTGIPADCNLPANTSQACVGTYEAEDVADVTIDLIVGIGAFLVGMASLIVLGWGLGQLLKKK